MRSCGWAYAQGGLCEGGLIRGVTEVLRKGGLICGGPIHGVLIGREIRYLWNNKHILIAMKQILL